MNRTLAMVITAVGLTIASIIILGALNQPACANGACSPCTTDGRMRYIQVRRFS